MGFCSCCFMDYIYCMLFIGDRWGMKLSFAFLIFSCWFLVVYCVVRPR